MATKISRTKIANLLADRLAAGQSSRTVVRTLAAYLIDTRTTREVELYLRDIMAALYTRHGHLAVDVMSACELSDAARTEIKRMVHGDGVRRVELVESIDADLIGGVIVRTPNGEMDSSVRNGLRKLRAI
jgi:F0F1-type ATP synthase delta subunit